MRKQAVITTFKSGLPSSLRAVAYAFQFPENKSVVPGNSNLKWTWMWKSLFYKCAPTSTIWRNSGRRFPLVRQKRNFISGREIIVGGREGKTSVVNDTMLQSYWTLWERTFSSSKNRWIPFLLLCQKEWCFLQFGNFETKITTKTKHLVGWEIETYIQLI